MTNSDFHRSAESCGAAQPFFSRRFSSRSTASRMNWAIPFSPTSSRIRSLISSGNRTCVALFPSGGLPKTSS